MHALNSLGLQIWGIGKGRSCTRKVLDIECFEGSFLEVNGIILLESEARRKQAETHGETETV